MEPQDELIYNNNGLTHLTLSEFLNTLYDTDFVTDKLRELLERNKMGGNEGIHISYEKEEGE